MLKLKISYFLSFLLIVLAFEIRPKSSFKYVEKPHFIKKIQSFYIDKYEGDESSRLLSGLLTGNKSRLKHKTKRTFKVLGIYHLLTISGLHLTCFLFPLYLARRKFKSRFLTFLIALISLSPLLLPGFNSLKRVGLLHFIHLVFPRVPKSILFILVFGIDILRGGYMESPLSFAFSFLFMSFFFLNKNKIVPIFLLLIMGQALISSVMGDPFSIIGSFIGITLTTLFGFIFPFIILGSISFFGLDHFLCSLFLKIINFITIVLKDTPTFFLTPESCLILFFIWSNRRHKKLCLYSLSIIPGILN
ncbi:MAG: ComEC/Rec2 family competence protein [Bacteriovoracaceae bacterium]|nr:ComEC/Rec2 family competence protein [Bacteriovoracaceae bacterium]